MAESNSSNGLEMPENWVEYFTDDGDETPYYYNIETGETMWEHPSTVELVENSDKNNEVESPEESTGGSIEDTLHSNAEDLMNNLAALQASFGAAVVDSPKEETPEEEENNNNDTSDSGNPFADDDEAEETQEPGGTQTQEAAIPPVVVAVADTMVGEEVESSNPLGDDDAEDKEEVDHKEATAVVESTLPLESVQQAEGPEPVPESQPEAQSQEGHEQQPESDITVEQQTVETVVDIPAPVVSCSHPESVEKGNENNVVKIDVSDEAGEVPAAAVSSLPENWLEFFTDDDMTPYYYNTITAETVWDRPGTVVCDEADDNGRPQSPLEAAKADIDFALSKSPVKLSSGSGGNGTVEEESSPYNPFGYEDDGSSSTSVVAGAGPLKPPKFGPPSDNSASVSGSNNSNNTITTQPHIFAKVSLSASNNNNNISKKSSTPAPSSNPFGDDDDEVNPGSKPFGSDPTPSGGGGNSGNGSYNPFADEEEENTAVGGNPFAAGGGAMQAKAAKNSNPFGDAHEDTNPFGPSSSASSSSSRNNKAVSGGKVPPKGSFMKQVASTTGGVKSTAPGIKATPTTNGYSQPAPPPGNRYAAAHAPNRVAHVNGVPVATPVVPQKQANVSPLFGSSPSGPSGPGGAGTGGGARMVVPPPPLAVRVGGGRNAAGNSPHELLSVRGNTMDEHSLSNLPPNMRLLLRIGVKPHHASQALRENENITLRALKAVNKYLMDSIQVDPYGTQLNIWGPRISTRIKSWLPNIMENGKADYHTGYLCTVNFVSTNSAKIYQPWQLTLRYSAFHKLYQIVMKHMKNTRIQSEFPVATGGHWLFGITDEIRNQRMSKFDTWLSEVLLNPVLMTTIEIYEAVNEFLEVNEHVKE